MLAMLLNEKEAAKVAGKVMDRKLHDSGEAGATRLCDV